MNKKYLNGSWQMRKLPDGETISLEVPGSVISGLLAAGKIEDPYYRENEYATREMFWNDFMFTRTFSVEENLLNEETVELVCEGLDTLTEIKINGKSVAKTSDMHRIYRFPVKKYLKQGENTIEICFFSVLKYIKNYEFRENREIHYVPCGAMEGNELVRKAHSMFGWDWGPQLVDAGIFRDIYLEAYPKQRIADVHIYQEHKTDGSVKVRTEIRLEDAGGNVPDILPEDMVVTLRGFGDGVEEESAGKDEKTEIKAIAHTTDSANGILTAEIVVEKPRLWWPNGYGKQNLYQLTVAFSDEKTLGKKTSDKETTDSVVKTIGLRTLTISQDKDQWGSEFCFNVNGVKIFTRGGNYIPDDAVYPNITTEKIDYILKSCVRANFNCVRVWGGGFFPSDAFFDLCDRYGLIVWQDLLFACNVYDVNDDFVENVSRETEDNVRRIRHHACLGLWCGNNEIESAWHHWGDFQTESDYLRADYIRLFEEILPRVVKANDPDTFYWRSSPSSGGCFDNPDVENRGDTHYWDVWHGQKPFTDYQKYFFRFCSEFGFQSFPSIKTVASYTKESDRNIFSKVMESHQKNDSANGKMLYYLSENLRYPKDFESLLYATQILQGIAIKSGVDHWRRNRGRCMGTLYWQINDNWPVASWAGIDYYGRWKALHYMARKFYAQIAGSLRVNEEKQVVELYLTNETTEKVSYHGTLCRKNFSCEIQETLDVFGELDAFSAKCVATIPIQNAYENFVEANVQIVGYPEQIHEVEVLAPYKHLELVQPEYEIQVTREKEGYAIQIKSNTFAPFVELDFKDADVIFSDDYFHLTGDGATVRFRDEDVQAGTFENTEDVKARLCVRSIRESY